MVKRNENEKLYNDIHNLINKNQVKRKNKMVNSERQVKKLEKDYRSTLNNNDQKQKSNNLS
jgi:polyhydroxyalkanoate synthesis regulator phasin